MSSIGIDYGSHMLKAAACSSISSEPILCNLGGHEVFLPAAVADRGETHALDYGWEAYQPGGAKVTPEIGFRDRLLAKTSAWRISGRTIDSVEIHAGLLNALRTALERNYGQAATTVFAVPDHWLSDRWSLPVAFGSIGWLPALIVREWNAVATHLDDDDAHPRLFVSAGSGVARATLALKRDRAWERLVTVHDESVSGLRLRSLWRKQIVERIIQRCRRDPGEDAEANRAVSDAMEAALRDLALQSSATFSVNLWGHDIRESVSKDELRALSQPIQEGLVQLVSQLLTESHFQGLPAPRIVVWGELTALLPIMNWLDHFRATGHPVDVLPLDAVATGAARLATWWAQQPQTPSAEGFSGLCPQCGAFVPKWTASSCATCRATLIPLAERLDQAPRAMPTQPKALLTLINDTGDGRAVEIRERRFRLGRNPLSDWEFSDRDYPTVSLAHAVILWNPSGYRIRDLGSSNDTMVNSIAVQECALTSGDEIRLGSNGPRLRFEVL